MFHSFMRCVPAMAGMEDDYGRAAPDGNPIVRQRLARAHLSFLPGLTGVSLAPS
jgi:hypothetical protein